MSGTDRLAMMRVGCMAASFSRYEYQPRFSYVMPHQSTPVGTYAPARVAQWVTAPLRVGQAAPGNLRCGERALMTTETLWQLNTCKQLSAALSNQPAVRALWLHGSLARDQADRFSDIDLVALIADVRLSLAGSTIETLLASEFEFVLVRNHGDEDHRLLNFVTDEWKRFDLSIFSADAIRRSNTVGCAPFSTRTGWIFPWGT